MTRYSSLIHVVNSWAQFLGSSIEISSFQKFDLVLLVQQIKKRIILIHWKSLCDQSRLSKLDAVFENQSLEYITLWSSLKHHDTLSITVKKVEKVKLMAEWNGPTDLNSACL